MDNRNAWMFVIVALALITPVNDVTSNENDDQRFESHIVATIKGDHEVIADCLSTSNLGNSQGRPPEVYVNRLLCSTSSGNFVTLVRLETDTGYHDFALVDLESGEWVKISMNPEIEPRGKQESRYDWFARVTQAQGTDYVVDVESSTRLFESVDKEAVDSWRESVWSGLTESDPDLASRVRWILENLGNGNRPFFLELNTTLRTYIYNGPELEAPDIIEEISLLGTHPIDESAMPDFEADFGKWAGFPDWPRVLDE